MFSSYEMTRALVTDRQSRLHHEARQDRLARSSRRARRAERAGAEVAAVDPAARPVPLPAATAVAAWRDDWRAA